MADIGRGRCAGEAHEAKGRQAERLRASPHATGVCAGPSNFRILPGHLRWPPTCGEPRGSCSGKPLQNWGGTVSAARITKKPVSWKFALSR